MPELVQVGILAVEHFPASHQKKGSTRGPVDRRVGIPPNLLKEANWRTFGRSPSGPSAR